MCLDLVELETKQWESENPLQIVANTGLFCWVFTYESLPMVSPLWTSLQAAEFLWSLQFRISSEIQGADSGLQVAPSANQGGGVILEIKWWYEESQFPKAFPENRERPQFLLDFIFLRATE